MPLLTKKQFLKTSGTERRQVGRDEGPPFDFWPYFEAIPAPDFQGHDCSPGVVENAWRMRPDNFMHVLVNSEDRNVFMVLILDLTAGVVHGHMLLDLNQEYGLTTTD